MTLDEQRAKEFAALDARLVAMKQTPTLQLLTDLADQAFDALNELEECGLISRRERVYWGEEFNAARRESRAAL